MTKKLIAVIVMLFTAFALTACGDSPESSSNAAPEADLSYVEGTADSLGLGTYRTYNCAEGLVPIDMGFGSVYNDTKGLSASLTETRGQVEYAANAQISVQLTVTAGHSVPVVVIHTLDYEDGPDDDHLLKVNLDAGATGDYSLPTTAFVNYTALGNAVSGATLCVDVSN